MNFRGRMIRIGLALASALLATLALSGTASAARGGGVLDGFAIGQVPRDVGGSVSDFTYEWEDVAFASRVWERETPDGGHEVDLTVIVLRGARLATADALRSFLAGYHERDPDTWSRQQVGQCPGFMSDDQVFWLVRPGVAVEVRANSERVSRAELLATANAIRPT